MEVGGALSRSPERLAWTVLLASFLSCCALAVGVPSIAWSFVNNATVPPIMTVKLQAGRTTAFTPPETEADARVVSQDGRQLEEGSTVIVDDDSQSQALITIIAGEGSEPLATLQLYSGARVTLERARLPRFESISNQPAVFVIYLQSGRMQVLNQFGDARVGMEVRTGLAVTRLGGGSYSFEQSPDETQIAAREGRAAVTAIDPPGGLMLQPEQRTAVTQEGGLQGILPAYRDLIQNGHFEPPLEPAWTTYAEVAAGGEVTGTVTTVGEPPDTSLLLDRFGTGLSWGRTGVQQELNESVAGRRSLQLRVQFTILYQELPVCGGLGSECPLMLTLTYLDSNGSERQWTQGFYADGVPSAALPDEIVTAPQPHNKHVAVRLGVRETYESEDLLGAPGDIQAVKSIRIYAEGHGVRTQVYLAELLVLD